MKENSSEFRVGFFLSLGPVSLLPTTMASCIPFVPCHSSLTMKFCDYTINNINNLYGYIYKIIRFMDHYPNHMKGHSLYLKLRHQEERTLEILIDESIFKSPSFLSYTVNNVTNFMATSLRRWDSRITIKL